MVIPFGALRGAARTQLFRQYAQARWSPTISAQTILNETKAMGLSIRRTNALGIIREMAGRELSRNTIRFVGDTRIPGLKMYAQTKLNIRKQFQTIFEVRGRNVLTGTPSTRQVSFLSDERMSVGDMKRELLEKVQQEYALREGVDYHSIVTLEGLQRATPPFIAED